MPTNLPSYRPSSLDTDWAAMQQILSDYMNRSVDTVIPVKVFSLVEGSNALINVQPVLLAETTAGEVLPLGIDDVIYNVPVMMFFGKNSQISFELQAGDRGLLFAAKKDISLYKETHQDARTGTDRTFSFSDGFFLPVDFQNVDSGIIFRNNQTKITITDGAIDIAGNGPVSISCTDASVTASGNAVLTAGADAQVAASGTATVTAATVNVNGDVNLGAEGGQPVARVGDAVQVDPITHLGTITSGAAKVKAV